MLLPLIGAGLGGFEGYRRSGGDIGAALLGAGLGAVTPAGLRMAGTALGATPLGASALGGISKLGSKAMSSGLGAGLAKAGLKMPAGPISPLTAAGLGSLAAGGGVLLGAPALAGALSAGAAKPLGQLASAATGALGIGSQVTGIGQPQLPDVPSVNVAGLTPSQIYEAYGPQGYAAAFDPTKPEQTRLALESQRYKQNLADSLLYAPYSEAYRERAREAELLRQAKSAQLSTALANDATMRQQAQLGAQRMGETFLTGLNTLNAAQPRYF